MTTTARSAPGGVPLENGFPTKIAFAADPDISFREVAVKPPGLSSPDGVDQTTMFNVALETYAPGALTKMTNCTFSCSYDPEVLDQILALQNVNGWITVHFSDGSTWDFVGFLKDFEPQEMSRNAQPRASGTIVPTNQLAGVETDPVYTAATP